MAFLPQNSTTSSNDSFTPKSSFIELASYDADSNAMTLTFKTGSQYKYIDVSSSTWESFKSSPDHSSFYAKALKGTTQSVPINKKTIGQPKSTPLKKLTQNRSLESHGIFNAGTIVHRTERKQPGNIPESLQR